MTTLGVRSDHAAIKVKFRLTAIKFNNEQDNIEIIYWKRIQTDHDAKDEFNERLSNYDRLSREPHSAASYTEFNANIILASQETATRKKTDNRGWFHHSENILLPIISYLDHLLHKLRATDSPAEATFLKAHLDTAQNEVTDNISLAKAAWSALQVEQIHTMRFNSKTAWESVQVLAGGMTSHNKAPTVMRLMLPTGILASTDAENASVMGPNFEKVYTNHRHVAWDALIAISQREEMIELDSEITWEELQQAIAKLKNGKAPGLNDVPPDAFKSLTKKT